MVDSNYVRYIIKKHIISDRTMAIDVKIGRKCVRIIAVYVPHAGYTWAEFETCMDDITILVSEATRLDMQVIIGGDFNLSLDTGRPGVSMTDLCHQFRLTIANSSGLSSADDIWTFRSTLGVLRRIDYILYSPRLTSENAGTTWDLFGFRVRPN